MWQVTVVVAAGNAAIDSCLEAPGNVNGTLNVGASDLSSKFGPQLQNGSAPADSIYPFSNTGPCVDIFAPGTNILAACGGESEPPTHFLWHNWVQGKFLRIVPPSSGVCGEGVGDHVRHHFHYLYMRTLVKTKAGCIPAALSLMMFVK